MNTFETTKPADIKQDHGDNNLNALTMMQDQPATPIANPDGRTAAFKGGNSEAEAALANLGLDIYPDTVARRQADNIKLAELYKRLPENSFSSTMVKDMKGLGLDNVDIWYGSNVQLNGVNGQSGDGGALYRKWSQLPGVAPRVSSHDHLGQEYQIKTGLENTALLFGCNPHANTFFQVEHNYAGGAEHNRDFQLYRDLNQNIGAKGISPFTDRHPLLPSEFQK